MMRLKSIVIDSFGRLKGKTFNLDPGLNVFYGPNESGKSTTMEFIRCTLVPNKSNKSSYPERMKTDSGTIVYEENGLEKRVFMEGKTGHKGDAPECVSDIEPVLYRNIFAMNREGLDEMATLSNGDIRSKFLTIPGGESMPDVIKSIDADWERLIGKTSTSPSAINAIQRNEDEILKKIGELRSHVESYSELNGRRMELEERLQKLDYANKKAIENNNQYSKVESQKSNFDSLAACRAKRDELMKGPILQDGAQDTYESLKNDAESKKAAYEALEQNRRQQIYALPGQDESKLLQLRPRIQSVVDRQPEYHARISRPAEHVQVSNSKMPFVLMALLAIAAVAVWLIPGLDVTIPIVADIAILAIIAFVYFRMKGTKTTIKTEGPDPWISNYEAEVRVLSNELRIEPISTDVDLRNMAGILVKLNALDATREPCLTARTEYLKADNKLLGFLAQYGGEQGYKKAFESTAQLRSCKATIATLESNIRISGLDPDRPLPDIVKIDIDMSEYASLSAEKGKIEEMMKNILDTKELDSLIDSSYTVSSEKGKVLREGAVSLVSSLIVQDACADLYENVHPDVISTADRYLGLMTNGSCRLDLDPRNTDISVISNGEPKNPKQWSTGLRAQILLSIKLAIAKEMGRGEIPIILDDVLLPFDNVRKKGAIEALSALSDEMQVLLFSCDDDVMEIAKEHPEISIITM